MLNAKSFRGLINWMFGLYLCLVLKSNVQTITCNGLARVTLIGR